MENVRYRNSTILANFGQMDQSGRLNDLDKFHLVFQHVWKSKNEFQKCWNSFSVVGREKKSKQIEKQLSGAGVPVHA